jgi:hypothetical protein
MLKVLEVLIVSFSRAKTFNGPTIKRYHAF